MSTLLTTAAAVSGFPLAAKPSRPRVYPTYPMEVLVFSELPFALHPGIIAVEMRLIAGLRLIAVEMGLNKDSPLKT